MNTPLDARKYAPATERNREAILEVLSQILPPTGAVLEIASGTGEHATFFASRLGDSASAAKSDRKWLPSDPNPELRASIAAWSEYLGCANIYPPIDLDASNSVWAVEDNLDTLPIAAIVNINMIHISPWSACLGLMAGAGRILKAGGVLYLYGPFKQNGKHTAPSNEAFDESLRMQSLEWGVRDLDDVVVAAQAHNLNLINTHKMPANNLSLIFQRV
ncbi:MAG: DUF938 domain-containing protein [Cyanomargarita calcarea GSE-NOS-MK-12-04C]|jgi:hypothetical protein|uniref:DUF938 domain-containing protein n=1 Tax=Cyanomargarita calcarea GSE-NOS-MK-12-04C TaxID=2839659 RepID=A0A951QM52_9CYAN|nr:DUF938 domain-containing protein [Cyanomargarita calcarea GSE-NOS-MK-12-04C]